MLMLAFGLKTGVIGKVGEIYAVKSTICIVLQLLFFKLKSAIHILFRIGIIHVTYLFSNYTG